ncbi:MAG: hypothetical protein ACOC95_03585 [Planctomycetota bacterium]
MSETRCPSCLARTRTRRQRDEDGDDRQRAAGRSLSRHFAPMIEEEEPPDAAYEAPPDMDPATVRVKHWYEKPTTLGWTIAAAIVALGGTIALCRGFYDGGAIWLTVGLVGLGAAVGLLCGSVPARVAALAGTPAATVVGLVLTLWMAPGVVSVLEAAILATIITAMVVGLSLLTRDQNTVGVVALGGGLALLGLFATCSAVKTTEWDDVIAGTVVPEVKRGLADMGKTLTTTRPAPALPADEPPAPEPIVRTEPPPPPPPPPAPEPAPAPRAREPDGWADALHWHGLDVAFPPGDPVVMVRGDVVAVGAGDVWRATTFRCAPDAVVCHAIVYWRETLDGRPSDDDLIALARATADGISGEIAWEMWRRPRTSGIYFIRMKRRAAGTVWLTRLEARRLGPGRVLVMTTQWRWGDKAAERAGYAFFKSLRRLAPDAPPAGGPAEGGDEHAGDGTSPDRADRKQSADVGGAT